MKIVSGGVTVPQGFLACGIHCGIKYKNKDLALIYSQVPAVACAVFTQNKVQAAPIKVSRAHLKDNRAQAIVVNSGNANCCTGKQGTNDARQLCRLVADELGITSQNVLVASTGIIGQRLPMKKIKPAIRPLVKCLSKRQDLAASQAIMTTDTKPKQLAIKLNIGRTQVHIGAMAKGAGMIEPHLATMLAFISTDAKLDKNSLGKALQEAVDKSFNLITVDGDTSTNDMVVALANGLAANASFNSAEFRVFQTAFNLVCFKLAKMIVKDAEGASKFVQVVSEGARNIAQAKKVAYAVANSPLVKTAIFGENPNWGRIAARIGAADRNIKQDNLSIGLNGVRVLQRGAAVEVSNLRLQKLFKKDEIQIKIGLGLGRAKATVYTCDLSDKYVKINAQY